MGDKFSKSGSNKEIPTFAMIGPQKSGKSKVLHNFLRDPPENLSNNELFMTRIDLNNGKIVSIWDFSGQVVPEYRKQFCQLTDGIIYVIDSTNASQLSNAEDEISNLILELPDIPILVFANKQDLPTAMDKNSIIQKLNLDEFDNKKLLVVDCSAFSGYNLQKGFKKLCKMKKKNITN